MLRVCLYTVCFNKMWWLNRRCGGSIGDVVAQLRRCGGSIGSAPDFWDRGPGFESGVTHNDPGALQDYCVIL